MGYDRLSYISVSRDKPENTVDGSETRALKRRSLQRYQREREIEGK